MEVEGEMRGHQDLIKMRMRGMGVKGVWVYYGKDIANSCLHWSKWDDLLAYPEVEILPIENINHLDLRFSVGLTVHLSTKLNYDKAKKLHQAFLAAKAKRVITVCGDYLIDSETGEHNDQR